MATRVARRRFWGSSGRRYIASSSGWDCKAEHRLKASATSPLRQQNNRIPWEGEALPCLIDHVDLGCILTRRHLGQRHLEGERCHARAIGRHLSLTLRHGRKRLASAL